MRVVGFVVVIGFFFLNRKTNMKNKFWTFMHHCVPYRMSCSFFLFFISSFLILYKRERDQTRLFYLENRMETIRSAPLMAEHNCRPVCVITHGGSWIWGRQNQEAIREMCQAFCRAGYCVVSVNYRLCSLESQTIQHLWMGAAAFALVASLSASEQWQKIFYMGLYGYCIS
jgi:predicted alpha/beta-fold hydrolase